MYDSLQSLYDKALRASSRPGLDDSTQQRIDTLWQEIHSGVDVLNESNFGPFLARHITERYDETPPEQRAAVLCNEGSYLCAVLRGELPAELQQSSSIGQSGVLTPDDARAYVRDHPKCHAIRSGLGEWDGERQRTERRLQQIVVAASSSHTPAIDHDNIPGAATPDGGQADGDAP